MSTSEIKCCNCLTNIPENQILKIGKCGHMSCRKCLVNFVKKNLKPRIKCPIISCSVSIFDQTIRKCLSNQDITLFENMSILGCFDNARKCPVKDCPYMYLAGSDIGVFSCEYCESPICMQCDDIHYPNNCGTYDGDKNFLLNKANENIKSKRRQEFIEINKKYDLMPNPDNFDCSFCSEYNLPRSGVVLRNCLHTFCEDCLRETYLNKNYFNQLKCQACNVKLENVELRVLIEEKRFTAMIISEAEFLLFHCKEPNCTGLWHVGGDGAIENTCPICLKRNCMKCNDIHEGQTCEAFCKSPRGIVNIGHAKLNLGNLHINCRNCNRLLIQDGGCGALDCITCGNHICVFTGLFAGKHDPEKCGCRNSDKCEKKGKYCDCDPKKPCDTRCVYGCYPH